MSSTPPRTFGCPFSNGGGSGLGFTKINGQTLNSVNGSSTTTITNGTSSSSNLSTTNKIIDDGTVAREIPKGGMLYGEYLHVNIFLILKKSIFINKKNIFRLINYYHVKSR